MGKCAAQETCRIVIEGPELVELKRHAHQIPECPEAFDLEATRKRFDL